MARKKAIAVAAPKATDKYEMRVMLCVSGSKLSTDEFCKLIRKGDGACYLTLDKLIGLPAFVEEGKSIDHPRSKERWEIMLRNTTLEEVPLHGFCTFSESPYSEVSISLLLSMPVEILKAGLMNDGPAKFRFLEELKFLFNDLSIRACWKLTHAETGESIYGVGTSLELIQENANINDEERKALDEINTAAWSLSYA